VAISRADAEDFVRLLRVFIKANSGQEDHGRYIYREGGDIKVYSSKDLFHIAVYQEDDLLNRSLPTRPVAFVVRGDSIHASECCDLPRLVEVLSRGLTLDLLGDAAAI
jgi:hypothetical protein